MNFAKFERPEKLRGGFYTPARLADYLLDWVSRIRPQRLLEPSCGEGVFLRRLSENPVKSVRQVIACEINAKEAAAAAVWASDGTTVLTTDFLRWYLFHGRDERFDAIVGNPPYIRYQYLPEVQQELAERLFRHLRVPFTRHTNAWVPFVLASLHLLRPGGRLALVLPSELLHIPHAQGLRQQLAEHCSRILVLDPRELWFPDTLQGTVLLLAERKEASSHPSHGVAVVTASGQDILAEPAELHFRRVPYSNGSTIEGKWMSVLLPQRVRALLQESLENRKVVRFEELAEVDVGIVTGANGFFLVNDATVEQFGLGPWAHPMFGRSEHAPGLIFSKADYRRNKDRGLPTNFIWFRGAKYDDLPASVQRYLREGRATGLHHRYKCRVRRSWYDVPSVYATPVSLLKRSHLFPRLILNTAGAYTTDTAYRIKPKGIASKHLVCSFVNSLTALSAELEGRHYGGGVLELVPSEIERLLVPRVVASPGALREADRRFRALGGAVEFVQERDILALRPLGYTKLDIERLQDAWRYLRNRRHRIDLGGAEADFAVA